MSQFKELCFVPFKHQTGNEVVIVGKKEESIVLNAEEAMWLLSELSIWLNDNYIL